MTTSEILHELKTLQPKYTQEGILILGLFGSYAKNNSTITSDVDVAIKIQDNCLKTHDVAIF